MSRLPWRAAALLIAVWLAASAALTTPRSANPDEAIHLDAWRWFESHVAPPPLGSGRVLYDPYGASRVWNGELVYPLLGRCGALWRAVAGGPVPPRLYRLLNVALLAAFLSLLLWGRSERLDLPRAGLLVASVPQVLYLFSYASSDGFAVVAASLLLLAALGQVERPRPGSWPLLGALAGTVLLAKETAWVMLPAALALVGFAWLRLQPRRWRQLAGLLLLAALLGGLRFAPRLLEPGRWGERAERVRAAHAQPRFDPGHPTAPGFHLRQRGTPFTAVALDPAWWGRTGMSSWAMYGFMTTRPPLVALALAALLWLALGGLALRGLLAPAGGETRVWRRWVPTVLGATCTAAVALSLLNSWLVDYQPQGRYLLPTVLPLALLLAGYRPPPGSRSDRWQLALLVAHALLGWGVALLLPAHVPPPPG